MQSNKSYFQGKLSKENPERGKQWTEIGEEKRENGTCKAINFTHAIFSDGERHGSSSSSSLSSLFSPSMASSMPSSVILNEEDVNISGTGRIDGLRLPICAHIEDKQSSKNIINRLIAIKMEIKAKHNLSVDWAHLGWEDSDCFEFEVYRDDFPH